MRLVSALETLAALAWCYLAWRQYKLIKDWETMLDEVQTALTAEFVKHVEEDET